MKPKKLNKDQIQKIVLSALGFIALIYCYFNFFLGPLNKSRAVDEQDHRRRAGQDRLLEEPR